MQDQLGLPAFWTRRSGHRATHEGLVFQRFSGPLSHKAGAYEQTHTKGLCPCGRSPLGRLQATSAALCLGSCWCTLCGRAPLLAQRDPCPLTSPPFPAVVIACRSTVHTLPRASPWTQSIRLRSPVLFVLVCMYICLVPSHLHMWRFVHPPPQSRYRSVFTSQGKSLMLPLITTPPHPTPPSLAPSHHYLFLSSNVFVISKMLYKCHQYGMHPSGTSSAHSA